MIDLTLFAGEAQPLRCSRLPALMGCPMSQVVELVEGGDRSAAADTGSAVHFATRLWHTYAEKDARLAVGAMRMALERFPLADLDAAERQFLFYAADPRNINADVVLCEAEVTIRLPPAEDDPTQKEVVIKGTLDQVRRGRGRRLGLWDIKTGSTWEGPEMCNEHCLQLAAYQFGASQYLREPVRDAGVIRTKDYLKVDRQRKAKPGPVFYEAPWGWIDVPDLLAAITREVARIRRAQLETRPSASQCRYCVGISRCCEIRREVLTKESEK